MRHLHPVQRLLLPLPLQDVLQARAVVVARGGGLGGLGRRALRPRARLRLDKVRRRVGAR